MTSGAQDLLSVLSMLPDGLSEHDLIQMRLPIPQILACKSTLIRTSLAFIDKDHQLKVLVPIREHVLSVYPPTNALKIKLCQYFHELLNLWNQFQYVNPTDTDIVAQILRNLGNFNSVFLHTLMMQGCEDAQNVKSILLLNRFYVCIEFTCSPLFPILAERMMEGEKSPMFGDYLVESFRSAGQAPVIDAERQIMLGNEYFKFKDSIEQGEAFFPSPALALIYHQPNGILHWEHILNGSNQTRLMPLSCIIMHFTCLIEAESPHPVVDTPLQAYPSS
jgi:hypothetical protein